MATFIFANNIDTTLAGGISSASTSLTLSSTQNLPSSVPAGSYLVLTLNDQATRTNYEIVYVTAISGATLTVLRGQEGTAAKAWLTGDFAFSGPTAGQMASFMQGTSTGVTPGTYGNSITVPQITVNAQGLVSNVTNVSIAFPITSFNGRAGAIVLNSGDVTSALGFNPVNKAGDTMTGTLHVPNLQIGPNATSTYPLDVDVGSGVGRLLVRVSGSSVNIDGVTPTNNAFVTVLTNSAWTFGTNGFTTNGKATFAADDNTFLSTAPLRFTGFGANGTVFIHGLNGSGDDICNILRNGANSNYTLNWNGSITCTSSSTSAIYVASGGNLRIGSTSGSSKYLRTNPSNSALEFVNNAYNAVVAWIGDDGTWNSVAGANFFASDENLKYDINRAANPRPLHHNAPWSTYRWKRDNAAGTGPIAQDVLAVAPEYVKEATDVDGKPFWMLDKPAVVQEVAYWAAHGVDGLLRRVTNLEDAVFGRD